MDRSGKDLDQVIARLAVDVSFIFTPRDGNTLCNFYAHVLAVAHRVPLPQKKANEQAVWLASAEAQALGWSLCSTRDFAQQRAEQGYPTFAVWFNPTGGHGHIAMLRPAPKSAPPIGDIWVTAAGRHNTQCSRLEDQFGLSNSDAVRFYTHP